MKATAFQNAVQWSRLTGQANAGLIPLVDRFVELNMSIDDGEIVVDGPSITDGYLGQSPAQKPWRTGDLGAIDQDGYLKIQGRKDSLIVTSFGRNVSPEWIETMLLGDLRVAFCAVVGHGEAYLTAVIAPSGLGEDWFANATYSDVLKSDFRLLFGRAGICSTSRLRGFVISGRGRESASDQWPTGSQTNRKIRRSEGAACAGVDNLAFSGI